MWPFTQQALKQVWLVCRKLTRRFSTKVFNKLHTIFARLAGEHVCASADLRCIFRGHNSDMWFMSGAEDVSAAFVATLASGKPPVPWDSKGPRARCGALQERPWAVSVPWTQLPRFFAPWLSWLFWAQGALDHMLRESWRCMFYNQWLVSSRRDAERCQSVAYSIVVAVLPAVDMSITPMHVIYWVVALSHGMYINIEIQLKLVLPPGLSGAYQNCCLDESQTELPWIAYMFVSWRRLRAWHDSRGHCVTTILKIVLSLTYVAKFVLTCLRIVGNMFCTVIHCLAPRYCSWLGYRSLGQLT